MINFIGYTDTAKLHAIFIKCTEISPVDQFEPWTYCYSLYNGDGYYYPCVIEKVSEEGYNIKFKMYPFSI